MVSLDGSANMPSCCVCNLPSIGILGHIRTAAESSDINAIEKDIRRVGHELIPLRRVPEVKRTDSTPVESNDTNQDRSQDQSIFRI